MIKGKVVLVPFPFDDLSSTKVRPAVCLTNPIGQHRHVVLIFVSSQIPADIMETDVRIDPGQADCAQTSQRVQSILRLRRLMTATTSLIQRELGELPVQLKAEVGTGLKKVFELP